ncbi:helix-turn-helix transcriptional regulator [Bifidobacterium longum]|uniref:helix-turn-helix transcriptional regulator n=1 Tax=Bifidobacterium longum TaxID=216816 RepID=UPI00080B244D|nr:helix-turn-helix transcriptional regulator [Bifidobacterium longum]
MGLRSMRESVGLSQQDLCRAIGSSTVGRVWAWEAWSDSPRPKSARDPHLMGFATAKVLADELGVTLDDLWAGLSG